VDRPVAYREVLKTWAKWVDRHVDPNRTTVFFMGMSPNHITYVLCLLLHQDHTSAFVLYANSDWVIDQLLSAAKWSLTPP
jgi:hypothetical protein